MVPDTKQVVIKSVSIALWQQLKARAAIEGRTMGNVLSDAIQHYLNLKRAA